MAHSRRIQSSIAHSLHWITRPQATIALDNIAPINTSILTINQIQPVSSDAQSTVGIQSSTIPRNMDNQKGT